MEKVGDPKEYELEFFREAGFERRKGKRCPEYFWTLNREFEEPQDTPCVEYRFDRIPSRERLTVREARSLFIDFFKRHGHTPVKPRPVVARWRDDLYLTIASIVVFQPHVTSGLVPPPANPLVISQPSIRLEDIDNVGLTIGRHLTSFEMAAHHAFNYPDKQVYWKNETVRLAYEFFTREMRIPPEEIVFKESWWEGGGNAGPSFEVVVGGIELATLVFMKYRVVDGKYEEIPLKIVDTGYGVERLAWFTSKTPTAFHTIFGPLVGKYRDLLGIEEPDEEILWAAFRESGKLDPEDPESIQDYLARTARRVGVSVEDVRRVLDSEARLYSLLDHARTLALMLGDGIVPSNTGEGYLARLVARRALKQLSLIGAEASLADLVDLQIDYWGPDYPQIVENRDYIIDALKLEEEKFLDVIRRGEKLISRILKKRKKLGLDDLIMLYDSHGLPPEIVAEAARRRGVIVEVPHNFYSIVASRHGASGRIARSKEEKLGVPREIIEWAKRFPPTRKLYYEDQYARVFTGKVLGVKDKYLVLDATLFYPTGGGQLHDTGIIVCGEHSVRVVNVVKVGEVVVHVLEGPAECSGTVRGEIDWPRRYRLMRHHTATHVIIGALRRMFGPHVWQAGAEKTPEKARLDFTHHRPLTREQVRELERLINRVVDERRSVRAFEIPKNLAEEKYGFQIYQGGVPMKPVIRLVEVDGWDIEGCGGTHLANTGEIGGIKIVSTSKIQDGVIRLEYVAATRVPEYAGELEDKLDSAASLLATSRDLVPERTKKLLENLKSLEEALNKYRTSWIENIEEELSRLAASGRTVFYAAEFPETDRRAVQEALKRLTSKYESSIIALYYKNSDGTVQVEIAAGPKAGKHLGMIVRSVASRHGGKGGGGKTYASVRLPGDKLEGFLRDLERELKSQ